MVLIYLAANDTTLCIIDFAPTESACKATDGCFVLKFGDCSTDKFGSVNRDVNVVLNTGPDNKQCMKPADEAFKYACFEGDVNAG